MHTPFFGNRSTEDMGSTTGSYLHGFAPNYPLPNLQLEEGKELIHNDNRLQLNFDKSLTPIKEENCRLKSLFLYQSCIFMNGKRFSEDGISLNIWFHEVSSDSRKNKKNGCRSFFVNFLKIIFRRMSQSKEDSHISKTLCPNPWCLIS